MSGPDRTDARAGAGILGLGAVACAACCAGPIVGFLAAAGVTAVLGAVVFGVAGLAVVAVVVAVLWRRRRRARSCSASPSPNGPVRVDPPRLGARSGPRDGA
jgi:membrane protein implicated in regulation of membrane protease activity